MKKIIFGLLFFVSACNAFYTQYFHNCSGENVRVELFFEDPFCDNNDFQLQSGKTQKIYVGFCTLHKIRFNGNKNNTQRPNKSGNANFYITKDSDGKFHASETKPAGCK